MKSSEILNIINYRITSDQMKMMSQYSTMSVPVILTLPFLRVLTPQAENFLGNNMSLLAIMLTRLFKLKPFKTQCSSYEKFNQNIAQWFESLSLRM
jgi:hypothetical protein